MAPTIFSIPERSYIVSQYAETKNYAEVKRRFTIEYGRQGPDKKTTRRLFHKFQTYGSLENRKARGNPRTTNTAENRHVRFYSTSVNTDLIPCIKTQHSVFILYRELQCQLSILLINPHVG